MIHVAPVPTSFDDRGLDTLAQALGAWPPPERLLLDARGTTWASPYGLAALLTLGQSIAELGLPRPKFAAPDSDDTRSYWARTGFFTYAAEYFELVGKIPRRSGDAASDTLLPLTPIRDTEDVHEVVGKLQEVATRILTTELKLEAMATMGFAMALSEACQNVVEHAETGGWVAAQTYFWKRRLGRKVAVIAVSDGGIGFRRSLEATEAKKVGERWGDGAALESAVLHSVSRFRDKEKGRGQGIAGIKRYIFRWHGKLSVRSGSARIAMLPEWDDDVPLAEHLPFFPGAQLQLTIPAQEAVSR